MKRVINLKEKLINVLMENGNKKTAEKIILKSFKFLQKLTTKNHTSLIQAAIINSTPIFRISQQKKKRKKKGKSKPKNIYTFISNAQIRQILSIKFLKMSSTNSTSYTYFYQKFAAEILLSSTNNNKSQSVKKKDDLHKQILVNKKYLKNFRWF
jgi:small subunit ribosomal protein S7